MKKRIIAALIALLLVGNLTAAAHEVPDLTKNGTITIHVDWNGEPLSGGSLSMYRVGDVVENDGNYHFACVAEIENISLEKLDDPGLAATLAAAAKKAGLEAITAPIADGKTTFSDVIPGLYVIVQGTEDVIEGFAPVGPFLLSMPRYEDGTYITDVTARPKVPLETEPTEPTEPTAPTDPTTPTGPEIPQTGQLNWPVPMLAALGLTFFAMGWVLCFGPGRKRKER